MQWRHNIIKYSFCLFSTPSLCVIIPNCMYVLLHWGHIVQLECSIGPDGDAGERARSGAAGAGGRCVHDADDLLQDQQLRTGMASAQVR